MIRNIIFDVGDVLLKYRWRDMLTKDHGLSPERAELIGQHMFESPYWSILDLGTESDEEVLTHFGQCFPDEIDDIVWFHDHADLMPVDRPAVWEAVHTLKEKGYRLYILSNYSKYLIDIHTAGKPFVQDFDGGLVSYEIHRIKPDPYIYTALLEKYDLPADECFFYDDRPANTAAAVDLGIESYTVGDEAAFLKHLASWPDLH